MKYIPVIGLEVHVELNTKSKMFCGCANNWFGEKPNTHTCPVCLGLPGALPVPNRKAIESCIKIGLSLHCDIPLLSKFDRKNYFYPDLAKGYQISQYDQPFAQKGWIALSNGKKIGITRAHMEEDTGKLLHETVDGKRVSLIDFNRSGVPLVEIVTEPDFETAAEVKEYLQKLQQIVRYLGVSNADMEKGEMRLEPNISLRSSSLRTSLKTGEAILGDRHASARDDEKFDLPKYKVEVKNINSFSFVEKAIAYEVERQAEILDRGETPKQETRGWDEDKKMTISQRSKEEAAEYRYFPDPDIPPFVWDEKFLQNLKGSLPELPDEKKTRFIKEYGLSEYNAELLTRTAELAAYFEEAVKAGKEHAINFTAIANTIINKKVNTQDILPAKLIEILIQETKIVPMDDGVIEEILQKVIRENSEAVSAYKSGKINAIARLIGEAMKELKGRVKGEEVRPRLEKLLKT